MKLQVVQSTGTTSTLTASDSIFAATVNEVLVAQLVRVYRSNARQGTSKVKSRGEVRMTTRKMYKQKGTGNARHHAQSAPLFVGGGIAHGPKGIENWSLTASKTQKKQALISALSWQAPQIIVTELTATKTKEMAHLISQVAPEAGSVLIVLPADSELQMRALRNLSYVTVRAASRLNTLDVVAAHVVIMTEASVRELEARLTASDAETVAEVSPAVAVGAPKKTEKKVAEKKPIKKAVKKTEKK